MRNFLTFLSATALLATPVMVQARGFDSDFSQTVTGPFKLEVVVSEDLAYRANNLPRKRESSRLNSAFANNGKYGDREIETLLEDMQDEITDDFAKRGLTLSASAPTLLRITINEVKPNRPTFKQLSTDVNLSFQSVGIGGADVSAELITAGGTVIGTAEYDYFSNLNDNSIQASGVWTDASRAFSQFSKKLSKKIAASSAESS